MTAALENYLTKTSYHWDKSKSPQGTNAQIRVVATVHSYTHKNVRKGLHKDRYC